MQGRIEEPAHGKCPLRCRQLEQCPHLPVRAPQPDTFVVVHGRLSFESMERCRCVYDSAPRHTSRLCFTEPEPRVPSLRLYGAPALPSCDCSWSPLKKPSAGGHHEAQRHLHAAWWHALCSAVPRLQGTGAVCVWLWPLTGCLDCAPHRLLDSCPSQDAWFVPLTGCLNGAPALCRTVLCRCCRDLSNNLLTGTVIETISSLVSLQSL